MIRLALIGLLLAWAGPSRTAAAGPLVEAAVAPLVAAPGDSVTVRVEIRITDGHHVQANPAAGEFLVPLEVAFEPVPGVAFGAVRYPPPHRHRLEGTEDDLLTYEGNIVLEIPLTVIPGHAISTAEIHGRLTFQACNQSHCFMPAALPLLLSIEPPVSHPTRRNGS